MIRKLTLVLCTGLLVYLCFPMQVFSDSQYTYAPNPDQKLYLGHISFTEIQNDENDPMVFSDKDQIPERAILNFPIGPGDTIRTSAIRRCEIQFDTGTIIRLDHNTQLRIETILAPSLSSNKKISNLLLESGQIYVMYKRYGSPEIFQVVTPNAALKLNHKSVAYIKMGETGTTDVWVDEGKVKVKYGAEAKDIDGETVKKSRQIRISPDHQLLALGPDREPEFLDWNENLNENFLDLHLDKSKLPKPIQKYPKAVHYFAQKYSYRYGEWLWHDMYGYVWRPFIEGAYPGERAGFRWRPMAYGQWTAKGNELYWIPGEPWGWVPYHLGVWAWDKDKGWLWLPGSFFSPAWVSWIAYVGISPSAGYYPRYLAWRPWYIWDWDYRFAAMQEMLPADVRKDLESVDLPYQLPKVYKKVLAKVKKAFESQNPELMHAIQEMPSEINMIMATDFNSNRLHEKFMTPDTTNTQKSAGVIRTGQAARRAVFQALKLGKRSLGQEICVSALQVKSEDSRYMLKTMFPADLNSYSFSHGMSQLMTQDSRVASSRARTDYRIRDFNPDIKIAQRYGVSIRYSSQSNQVICPELKLSSGFSSSRSFWNRTGGNKFAGQAAAYAQSADAPGVASAPGSPAKVSATASAGTGTAKTRTKKD